MKILKCKGPRIDPWGIPSSFAIKRPRGKQSYAFEMS